MRRLKVPPSGLLDGYQLRLWWALAFSSDF